VSSNHLTPGDKLEGEMGAIPQNLSVFGLHSVSKRSQKQMTGKARQASFTLIYSHIRG